MPVWNAAMNIAVNVFKLTKSLPGKEDYGLTSQIRRSSLSISDNISEGFGRVHAKDKINFYIYSRGSANETKSQLIYGSRVGYFKDESVNKLMLPLNDIIESLNKLMKSMR